MTRVLSPRPVRHGPRRPSRLFPPPRPRPRDARAEPLETRALLSVYTVTTTADEGAGSLRQAIDDANAAPGADEIRFDVPGEGVRTVAPLSALPAVTGPLTIDATSQPGYLGSPLIELSGAGAGPADGLTFAAAGVVRGLTINRFAGSGIVFDADTRTGANAGGSRVEGCYIGTNAAGDAAAGNGMSGVSVRADDVTIGGTGPGQRNVISGNAVGIAVAGSGVLIQGNYVGTDAYGVRAVGNRTYGIWVSIGNNCRVGGTAAGAGNVISGNGASGVRIGGAPFPPAPVGTVVEGNHIGTDVFGTRAVPNGSDPEAEFQDGVTTFAVSRIGGPTAASRNVISGNHGAGIAVLATDSRDTDMIQGNYVGTDVNGGAAVPNGADGVMLDQTRSTFGRPVRIAGNVVSGNQRNGIHLIANLVSSQPSSNLITIAGNFVGADASGRSALGNGGHGIALETAKGVTIGAAGAGGAAPAPGLDPQGARGNVVSANAGHGVFIAGRPGVRSSSGNIVVTGNYVGLSADGSLPLGNGETGVYVIDATNVTVGGTAAGAGNVISANGRDGVTFRNALGRVVRNRIGTNGAGDDVPGLGNAGNGVRMPGSTGNAGEGNVVEENTIEFNGGNGVLVEGSTSGSGRLRLTRNSIYSNGRLGIDVAAPFEGVSPDHPVILSAVAAPDGTYVRFTAYPGGVEFFVSPAPDPSGFGEGKTYLGESFTFSGDPRTVRLPPVPAGSYITATGSGLGALEFSNAVRVAPGTVERSARVVDRRVFYNNSVFDPSGDEDAIAPDKVALLPGQAPSFENVTSYTKGINGIIIDVAHLPADYLTKPDLQFRMSGVGGTGGWTDAPEPRGVGRLNGQGTDRSDRVVVTWDDPVIRNRWIEVTVKANERSLLPADDVFYFGNLVGETGDAASPLRVTALDVAATRRAIGSQNVSVYDRHDFDRNGVVNALDLAAVRANISRGLQFVVPPAAGNAGPAGAADLLPLSVEGVWRLLEEPKGEHPDGG